MKSRLFAIAPLVVVVLAVSQADAAFDAKSPASTPVVSAAVPAAHVNADAVYALQAGNPAPTWNDVAQPGVGQTMSLVAQSSQSFVSHKAREQVKAVAAPVAMPEPETYALLGAGLGIIGFVAVRRRRDA